MDRALARWLGAVGRGKDASHQEIAILGLGVVVPVKEAPPIAKAVVCRRVSMVLKETVLQRATLARSTISLGIFFSKCNVRSLQEVQMM